ncbi:ATP-binding protein [Microbacterium sp. KKR3/1]|uniref:ATP-binding protein n=1 Tax=Microbacterium sp. KKR3/1 TaxID=2904241 RepID=UPI001E65A875|nr:ATP-binding protein [Microbacterium sp. KKR3/1]MCE0510393.1 ATP-binding protein [Microbacterium sp. KKR3/1]
MASSDGEPPAIEWRKLNDYDDAWFFNGQRRYDDRSGSIVISRRDLEHCSVSDFRRQMLRANRHLLMPERVMIADGGLEDFDSELVGIEPVWFEVRPDGEVAVRVHFEPPHDYDLDDLASDVSTSVGPFLTRSRAHIIEEAQQHYGDVDTLLIGASTRGRSLQDLFAVGEGVSLLGQALLEGRPGRTSVGDLVLAGRADLLVGFHENEWFDAKSDHYVYDSSPAGKIKLARAIAQFCNGEFGGTIVIGLRTRKAAARDSDEVVKLTPVPLDRAIIKRYREAVQLHLFPFPEELRIETVETFPGSGQGYVVVTLPPQPEELKPYLVHGAIVEGSAVGSFFSIVRRSGEDGLPIHASQVHSMLVTGRAFLRHGLGEAVASDTKTPR